MRSREVFVAVVSLTAACSSPPPPSAPPPPPAAEAPAPPRRSAPAIEGEIGGMNQEAMERAFASLPLSRCFDEGTSRLATLGGHFTLKVRIGTDGSARWAYLGDSTLGDRATEKCVLDLARDKAWPRPVGGEGLAERSWDLDPRREPSSVDEDRIKKAAQKARQETAKCRSNLRGPFVATAYVRRDGKVLAAGVAPPNEKGEQAADCIVEELLKIRFPTGREAKVSFEIP